MSFIRIENLKKSYLSEAGDVHALRGVDLALEEGGFYGIMGPSGSGKSTLLTILGGLCTPSDGQILVDDIDLYQLSGERLADFRREYLGFVFQAFNLVPYLTALENVMLPLAVKSMATSEKKEMALKALERVGLSPRATHLPNQLSGGEQERVAIARALVNNPPLILADEPTGSLDSSTAREIMELLQQVNGEGQTIVMVTHNPENTGYFSQTVRLRDGALEETCIA